MNAALSEFDEMAIRSAMKGAMWDDLATVETRRSWPELRAQFAAAVQETFSRWVARDQPHFREQLIFALGRFDEGAGLTRYFERFSPRTPAAPRELNVLDIGAGNGGVAVAMANVRRYRVHALDIVPNNDLRVLKRILGMPVHPIVANGHAIPYAPNSFDIVLLLDTIEHVPRPRLLAREVMRILRPGGACMLTTPARLRHLFGPDPHYGVPGLVLFPNPVQRLIVNQFFRRRVVTESGGEVGAYDVTHIFWHVREILGMFPDPKSHEVLFNRGFGKADRFSREWWRHKTRHFLWDRLVIFKES